MSERIQDKGVGGVVGRAKQEAERRGHPSRTAYAGIGGLLGGILGSFFGRSGAGVGGLLGALVGAIFGHRRDTEARALPAGETGAPLAHDTAARAARR